MEKNIRLLKRGVLAGAVLVLAAVFGVFGLGREAEKSAPSAPEKTLVTFVDRGLDEAGKAELEQKIQTLESAMTSDPAAGANIANMLQLGNLKYSYGDLQGAREWYERILSSHPQDAPALENLGQTLLEMGDAAGAEERWRSALAVSPYEVTYLKLADLIDAHFPEKNGEIQSLLEEAIATLGQTPGLLVRLGEWYAEQQQYEKAISHYRVAKQLDPDDPTIDPLIAEARDALSQQQKQAQEK